LQEADSCGLSGQRTKVHDLDLTEAGDVGDKSVNSGTDVKVLARRAREHLLGYIEVLVKVGPTGYTRLAPLVAEAWHQSAHWEWFRVGNRLVEKLSTIPEQPGHPPGASEGAAEVETKESSRALRALNSFGDGHGDGCD
jgi:hypothetical protein